VVSGEIRLAEGAALPAYAPADLERRALHEHAPSGVPAACAASALRARQPVELSAQGALAGVVVAASDFTRHVPRKKRAHHAAIRDCRLQPATISATQGDVLVLENRDAFAFEPLVEPSYTASPLGFGKRRRIMLGPGIESIQCSRAAPCGRLDVVVFRHSAHAVTDRHGRFRIADFPAAQTVRISAWHPLFEPSETFVWVEPGGHGRVQLVLKPRSRFVQDAGSPAAEATEVGSGARP